MNKDNHFATIDENVIYYNLCNLNQLTFEVTDMCNLTFIPFSVAFSPSRNMDTAMLWSERKKPTLEA